MPVFFDSFTNEFIIGSANDFISVITGEPGTNIPNWTILGNGVFERFILADEQYAKTLQIFESRVLFNNN